ncbi:MAG: hypothetical protein N3C59_07850 [Azovibrio sp.]|nr:hypothetical protein [Azovibrio sp.]
MLINFTSTKESREELLRLAEAMEGSAKIMKLIKVASHYRFPQFTAEDYRAMFRACDYLKEMSGKIHEAHARIEALAEESAGFKMR